MGTALENLRSMRKEVKSKETTLLGAKGYATILRVRDLDEGKTTFRVVKHPDDPLPFLPVRLTWLDVEENINNLNRYQMEQVVKDKKLEKVLGANVEELKAIDDEELRNVLIEELGNDFTILVRKAIFISKMHGNAELPDIVEEYIKTANKMISDIIQDPDERKKKKAPITGWRDKQQKWNPGIMPSTSYVAYMFPLDAFGGELKRFELYSSQMDEIEKLYAKFDDSSEPLTVDPFSDPEEGWPIEFNKVRNDKGGFDITIVDKPAPKRMSGREFVSQFALTSEQMEELEGKPSLTSLYVNVYGSRDFLLALNGLQLFDEKHGLNVFQNDEFLKVAEQLSEYYSGQSEEKGKGVMDIKPKVTPIPTKEVVEDDGLKILDEVPGKFSKLKQAKENERKLLIEELKGLDSEFQVPPFYTNDDIRGAINDFKVNLKKVSSNEEDQPTRFAKKEYSPTKSSPTVENPKLAKYREMLEQRKKQQK